MIEFKQTALGFDLLLFSYIFFIQIMAGPVEEGRVLRTAVGDAGRHLHCWHESRQYLFPGIPYWLLYLPLARQ